MDQIPARKAVGPVIGRVIGVVIGRVKSARGGTSASLHLQGVSAPFLRHVSIGFHSKRSTSTGKL